MASKKNTRPAAMTVLELDAIASHPSQPVERSQRDALSMAMDLQTRGQFNPILIGVIGDELVKVQGHRRVEGAKLGVELGILPDDYTLRVEYREYATMEASGTDFGDHGATLGLENKFQLFETLAPILRSGSMTGDEIALVHAESFRQVWNTKDEKEAIIRAKVETAQIMAAAGKAEAAEVALAEAKTEAGKYRNGAIQTYRAVAKLPSFVAAYMRRQWLGELAEGEPVLSQGDFVAISKAMKEGGIESSDFDAIETLFETVKADKVKAAEAKAAKKAEVGTPERSMMKRKVIESLADTSGNKLFSRILRCILNDLQSEIKALDADMTTEGIECQYEETKKVNA